MLLFSLYKSKLWTDLDEDSRNIRIIVLAGTLYIILHSYLYSKYTKNINLITNYRYLIYFLLLTDLLITWIDKLTTKEKKIKIKRPDNPLVAYLPSPYYHQNPQQIKQIKQIKQSEQPIFIKKEKETKILNETKKEVEVESVLSELTVTNFEDKIFESDTPNSFPLTETKSSSSESIDKSVTIPVFDD